MLTMHSTPVSFSDLPSAASVLTPPPKDRFQLDIALDRLRRAAGTFARLSLDERISLVASMQRGCLKTAERSVALGCLAKGITRGTPREGEEWATGPWAVVRHLRLLREQLTSLKEKGVTSVGRTGKTAAGNLSVRVFPASAIDALLFKDVTVDVHLQEGMTPVRLEASRAGFYRLPAHSGKIVLVLGAGNLASLPVMDVLTKMFNEGKVCMLKMNPVNAYLGPLLEEAFSEAIERGFLSISYGGAKEGAYLIRQESVDEVHLTGSDKTYDAIVWGPPGPERDRRKRERDPLVGKPLTSELGNVSPVIIVPGPYTDRQLRYLAEDIAGYFTMNASCLCCTAKVLITSARWDRRDAFLQTLAGVLRSVPQHRAYYPGAVTRFRRFAADRKRGHVIGVLAEEALPWMLATGLDPDDRHEVLFSEESFCPVLGETALDSDHPADFLDQAVAFANGRLWGTLSAAVMVHPATAKDPVGAAAVERAIERLRYGTVSVNAFPGMSFVFGSPPWGAYPGSAQDDIQSGQGWVHNTAMLAGIEKVVARFPFMSFPKPAYFTGHRTVHTLMRRMTALEENGSWWRVPAVVWAALRG